MAPRATRLSDARPGAPELPAGVVQGGLTIRQISVQKPRALQQIEQIDRKHPDLIIVGAQSGTIPFDIREPRTHCLSSISFLLATQPDACLLVVNGTDPDQYIADTISAIRCLAKVPVIILAMSDTERRFGRSFGRTFSGARKLASHEMRSRLGRLETRFGLPAIGITCPEGQRRLLQVVLNYFGA